MKRFLAVAAAASVLALASCQDAETPLQPETTESLTSAAAPNQALMGGPQSLADRWIVVFADQSRDPGDLPDRMVRGAGGTLHFTYRHAIKGFAATLPPPAVEALRRNPQVAYVEADQVMQAWATQSNATWGLDRVDQRALPLNGTYIYDNTGAGVNSYILDTGIRLSHTDFGGRAVFGYDAFNGDGIDCNGHGTHVAGTVGGATWGIAKGVKLFAVRVLDCNGSGTTTGVIAGIDWVTANHKKPAVANMSLGGGASDALDEAVQKSIAAGVGYAVAAGNGNWIGRQDDACKYSPARVPEAMTIGATTSSDAKASYSNYGNCVDWFAPGSSITSAWHTNNTATNTISGTSMAAPHTAGAAALYLQTNTTATPQQVRDAIYAATTKGIVTSSNTANNHLLYTLFGDAGGGDENQSPTVTITSPANGSTFSEGEVITFTGTATDNEDGDLTAEIEWTSNLHGLIGTGGSITPTLEVGVHTIVASVKDSGNKEGTAEITVTVSEGGDPPVSADFTLTALGYKVKGVRKVELTWSGSNSTFFDLYLDGALNEANLTGDTYIDDLGRNSGTFVYKICEAGTSTCSNTVTVTF